MTEQNRPDATFTAHPPATGTSAAQAVASEYQAMLSHVQARCASLAVEVGKRDEKIAMLEQMLATKDAELAELLRRPVALLADKKAAGKAG